MRQIGLRTVLKRAIAGEEDLVIRTGVGGVGKYGRLLGWLYIGDQELSLNEIMITEGYVAAIRRWNKTEEL